MMYPTSRLSPGWSSRAITTACSTPVQLAHRGLYLTELDAVPADLDLLIGPSQVAQLPVGGPTDQIAGAIHPGAGSAEWTRDKP